MAPFDTSITHARSLDAADPLLRLRERFHLTEGIYLNGNSLGLLSRDAEAALQRSLTDWRHLGIGGWTHGDPAWLDLGERVGAAAAGMVGANADEVVATGTTTVNIHALVASFYAPAGRRTRILADALTFPSDLYALSSQVRLRGFDPRKHLIRVPAPDGRYLDEDALIEAMTDDVALALFPSVLYRSGQLLDMARITEAAHRRGVVIGFDCSHSAGAIPHQFDAWGVDFAVWCGYKHLCGGPGSSAFMYVNRAHHDRDPALVGWWGSDKKRLMDMLPEFRRAAGAAAWQISTPAVLALAPLLGALEIIGEAGVDAVREKSLRQTTYMMDLIEALLPEGETGVKVGTPREAARRGPHVAVEYADARALHAALARRGIVTDLRPPDVIRIAPAFYNTCAEIWRAIRALESAWRELHKSANGD